MIQRRKRPSFSKDEEEGLLAYMQVTRQLNIYFGAAQRYDSPLHVMSVSLKEAIDKLAEGITGDSKFFWAAHHSAGDQPSPSDTVLARQERELRWEELRRKY